MQTVLAYLLVFASWLAMVGLDMPRSILVPLIRQRGRVVRRMDRSSAWAIVVADNVTFMLAGAFIVLGGGGLPALLFYIGTGMMIAGIALRQWAMSALGRFWAPTVRIVVGHRTVTSGPYRYVRHPSYTGALLFMMGLCIAAQSIIVVALGAAILIPAYIYRIRKEEAALSKHVHGYCSYMRSVSRLLVPVLF